MLLLHLLTESTGHISACLQGFCAAVSLALLQAYLVSPHDLTTMGGGSSASWQSVAHLQEVFHVVLDCQLQTDFKDLATCLWEVNLDTSLLLNLTTVDLLLACGV